MKAHGAAFVGPILFGLAVGVLDRAWLLYSDYRRFPSQPHGRITYLFLGFVAALLGALAMPAVLTGDFTAGVFLALGTQQFHTVRSMERTMLLALDHVETVPRGHAYIEGIAAAFEARNYLVIAVALASTSAAVFLTHWAALAAAAAAVGISRLFMRGAHLEAIARVEAAPVEHEGEWITVRGLRVFRTDEAAAAVEAGRGLWIEPRDMAARMTLGGSGQRQAILHDLAARLGVQRTPSGPLLPQAALERRSGAVAVYLAPLVPEPGAGLVVARRVPVLEATAYRPPPRAWLSRERGGG